MDSLKPLEAAAEGNGPKAVPLNAHPQVLQSSTPHRHPLSPFVGSRCPRAAPVSVCLCAALFGAAAGLADGVGQASVAVAPAVRADGGKASAWPGCHEACLINQLKRGGVLLIEDL